MRTLKKSLSLVLALVMVLGLFVVGTNAAYADKETITYADAVEVLTGLGVIEGYPDGEFKPIASVTRAEAAAMITRMMLGREAADKLPIGDVKFSDVPETNWAAKYIAFCANRGIIVGMGDGTFHPSENVTGTQMATMLLRALGYGVMGEYEGKGWDINAVADALYYKVFEDSKVTDFSKAASREETALYVFNTLWVDLVAYDVDIDHYVYRLGTFASQVYKLYRWEYAQVMENQATGSKYTVVKGTRWYTDEDGKEIPYTGTLNFDIETGLDLIAHEVTVYYKTDSREKDKQNNYYYKAFVVQDNSTILDNGAYWADAYKNLVAANKDNKYDDLEFDVWINYVYTVGADTLATSIKATTEKDTASAADLKGDYINSTSRWSQIVLDSNGRPLAYMKTVYTVDQVKKIEDGEIILKNDAYGFDTYDPALAYEGIKKGDYVTVQPVGDLCYLYPTTTEEISVYERSVLVDFGGSWMYFNFFSISPSSGYGAVTVPDTESAQNIQAGDKVLFYKDCYGKYFATQILERGTLKGVVLVVKAWTLKSENAYGEIDDTIYVQTVDQEGKEAIYTLKEGSAMPQRGVYQVFTDSKDKATLVTPRTSGLLLKEENRKTALTKDGGIYYVTNDTNIYYVNGEGSKIDVKKSSGFADGEYNVYALWTGTQTYNLNTVWVLDKDAPIVSEQFLFVDCDKIEDLTVDWDLYFATGEFTFKQDENGDYIMTPIGEGKLNGGTMLVDDEKTYYYTFYIDGVETNGCFKTNDPDTEIDTMMGMKYAKGGFYTFNIDEFNRYELAPVKNTASLEYKTFTLERGDIHNGKLYVDADGVKIDATVINLSDATTADGKRLLTIENIGDIEELLEDGGNVTVHYMAVLSNGNWVPTGTIYVTAAEEAAED